MDLLTVTYLEDIEYMIRQAESIQKFVEPCTHWVIINDNSPLSVWEENIKHFYTIHSLHLLKISNKTNSLYNVGHHRQQYLKLYVSKFLTKKYLVLDSKNFFIKACSTKDWNNQIGPGKYMHIDKDSVWFQTVEAYKKILEYNTDSLYHLSVETPFVIDSTLLKIDKFDDIMQTISQIKGPMSEFLLYSLLYERAYDVKLNKINLQNVGHQTVWEPQYDIIKPKDLIHSVTQNKYSVMGIHSLYYHKLTNEEIDTLNGFLLSLGLSTLFKKKYV